MSTIRKVFSSVLCVAVFFSAVNSYAQDAKTGLEVSVLTEKSPSGLFEEYKHIPKAEYAENEKIKNFGIMYGLQWAVYLVTQWETIEEHGSFKNWINNPAHPDYDKDTYDYNIFKHAYSGQLYYQFYRSRGYDEVSAFYWTIASSIVFEFTIETVTEVPSFQDMHLTPVLGTVVGVGFEKLSLYYHSKNTTPYRLLGYIFNPFTLLSSSHYGYVAPVVSENYKGVNISWSFE